MKTFSPFVSFIEQRTLRRLAGATSFERGEDYFVSRQVEAIAEDEGTITAKVRGTYAYRVKLWIEKRALGYSCTCPVGADGEFCKHCVAVGLTWLENRELKTPEKSKSVPGVTIDDVRAHLLGQDKRALVDMLVEHAMEDDRLRQRLSMKAAKKSSKALDLTTFQRAIDDAVEPDGFVDYRSAYQYASGIGEVIDSVEDLLKEGFAREVVEVTEHALEAVEEAMGSVDDSDGEMGTILERLQDLHHRACKKAKPDPDALARRLFDWEMHTDYDTFYGAAETYASILGETGLAVYRTLAEAEWAKVPVLGPGRDDPEKYGKRFRITHIMETLARQTGDVEAVVAVKKRDLSLAYHYLQVAETYKSARQHDLALEWAERGVKAFPKRTDSRLREFLAGEYHRRKRHDEAMALIWTEFSESPGLELYRNLKAHAERNGQWEPWRKKALDYLRSQITEAKSERQKDRWSWYRKADHSELVRIFLWEKDVEGAWHEAQEGGCSNDLWLELAAKREKEHPQDALPIYQRQIEPTLDRKNNDAYREAIGLLRKVRELMVRLEQKDEFTNYLDKVRAAHKPKRNFMKLLDRERL
ncbi:MAG TPA: SWIM zinc finger family protein [Methylomirabilota bacterium]|nr:SWIM zinc finger family protein [Methylomirabilota bacterium]